MAQQNIHFIIRGAEKSDVDMITAIENATLLRWRKEFFLEEIASKQSKFFVAIRDSTVCGFLIARKMHNEAEIYRLAVREEYRRSGIGSALVNHLIDSFQFSHGEKIFLEVGEQNNPARAHYRSLGFVETGVRKGYYENDNAVLMEMVCENNKRTIS